MKRRDILYATGIVSLGGTLAGCTTGRDNERFESSDSETTSDRTEPTLQQVVVNNSADETKRIGIEVAQNHENRVHTGYSELEPSNSHTLTREWPPQPGEFCVVLHVPDDERYNLVTFSTLAEHRDWNEDVKVVYEIRANEEIHDNVVELSSDQ